jgi:hypothetical protein
LSNFLQDGLETPALSGFDVTFFLKKAVIYNVKSSLLKSFCRFLVTSCLYPILKQRQINGFKHLINISLQRVPFCTYLGGGLAGRSGGADQC